MAYISKIKIGNNVYEIKDTAARNLSPIILTVPMDSSENFKGFATPENARLIEEAINSENPMVFVKWTDVDGLFLAPVSIALDGSEAIVRVHGFPYDYSAEPEEFPNKNIIAISYTVSFGGPSPEFLCYNIIRASIEESITLQ